jgi:UDP-glucose 4-epimerase
MILLTGASGFIGKNLIDELNIKCGNDKFITFSSKSSNDTNNILHDNYTLIDTKDIDKLKKITIIIHAGAFTPKDAIESQNIEKSNSNINNTLKLLGFEFPNLKKIIYLSTLDVYESNLNLNEESKVEPISMYGWSKLYCEKLIENWCIQNNILSQILRIGHVYGPGEEKYKKLIPETIKNILNNRDITLINSGIEKRSYIYISDLVDIIFKTIDFDYNIGLVNISGNETKSILEVVEILKSFSVKKVNIKNIENNKIKRDITFDNSRMTKLFGIPKVNLFEGLNKEWNYLKQQKIHEK